ncbi:hypothetical protein KEM54_002107 [Ascosphaera aggregata]|nr:hypothetical protein KEM54_002107 [Ascosphaera aggregata]
MFRILESQAPARQTATDTINVLSSRLQSATLLEDRRAAILGLRSFSKEYPASVASGALRPLITCLKNDVEDVDTIKIVLETLLMLFAPDENSPEASDEIALWLADEFTQRQDNITSLLDLLESGDFYSRLYSLQLISSISSARPERTQESIFTAPLGISRLVSLLDEPREPIRNEALLLLISLTSSSPELQKVVAFENAFDKIFALIDAEGALSNGSEVVADCLALLANLLNLNHSNQSYFRETAGVKRLALLLSDATKSQDEPVPQWMLADRDKNTWGLLAIVRIFLVKGGFSTVTNQKSFWHNGLMEQALRIAFSHESSMKVRAMAFNTCADMISGNAELQESFADIDVVVTSTPPTSSSANTPVNGEKKKQPVVERLNVIEALLRLLLEPGSLLILDLRLAASECMKAFFAGHAGIRGHFLRRAIEGHSNGQDKIPNLFTVLLRPPTIRGNSDPYQSWLASVLLSHLVFDDPDAKALACKVHEGDEANGEEVVTCVQAITANLVTGLQKNDDIRISIGYLMLLCMWLWEDPDVVNDFLAEGSSIQTLIQETKQSLSSPVLLPGLCAVLLGIAYEFSTKDSPLPRSTLHELISGRLGRERYIDKITKLRSEPSVRDFEILPQIASSDYDGGLPEIYFDKLFIDFLKDNFSRLVRAIDREPGYEISVVTRGVEKGISRELVDALRSQVDEKGTAIQKLEMDILTLQQKLEAEQSEHRKSQEKASLDLSRLKTLQDTIMKQHEIDLRCASQQSISAQEEMTARHGLELHQLEEKLLHTSAQWEKDLADRQQAFDSELSNLRLTIEKLQGDHDRQAVEMQKQHEAEVARYQKEAQQAHEQYQTELSNLKHELKNLEHDRDQKLVDARSNHFAEVAELRKIQNDLNRKWSAAESRAEAAETKVLDNEKKLQDEFESKVKAADNRAQAAETKALEMEKKVKELEMKLQKADDIRKAREEKQKSEKGCEEVQSELDDLLVVFADLEEKRKADKKKLRELGQETSDDEDDEE